MKLETLFQPTGFGQASWRNKTVLLATIATLVASVAVGCETADPADEPDTVVITGVPVGGGPVEEDDPYDVANLETALERPALYVGNTVIGQATVYQVISERAAWLESGNRRVFTMINQSEASPGEVILRRGQVVQLSGELRSGDDVEEFTAQLDEPLDRDIMAVLANQEYFLEVSANTIEVITRGVSVVDRVDRSVVDRNAGREHSP